MNLDVLKATWDVVKAAAASQNKEVELTALGVGAKTKMCIRDRKGLVYPCFCSRSQLHAASAPHTSDGIVWM